MFEDTNEAGVAALISDKEKMRRRRISDSRKGIKLSQETKDKISKLHKGRKYPDDHKAMLSKLHKGKKMTEEAKEKISDHQLSFGELHPAAVDWCFRSPCGALMQGLNLQLLIRTHSHLFDDKDIEPKKTASGMSCIAYHALTRLKAGVGKTWGRKSWKGWTYVSNHSQPETEKEIVS